LPAQTGERRPQFLDLGPQLGVALPGLIYNLTGGAAGKGRIVEPRS
jgi:hypothetical protein